MSAVLRPKLQGASTTPSRSSAWHEDFEPLCSALEVRSLLSAGSLIDDFWEPIAAAPLFVSGQKLFAWNDPSEHASSLAHELLVGRSAKPYRFTLWASTGTRAYEPVHTQWKGDVAARSEFMQRMAVVSGGRASFVTEQSSCERDLERYGALSDGWDGPESRAPSPAALITASLLIKSLKPGFPLPKAMLSYDGRLGLYWKSKGLYADIEFDGDGSLSIFVRNKDSGDEAFEDALNYQSLLNERADLLEMIRQLA